MLLGTWLVIIHEKKKMAEAHIDLRQTVILDDSLMVKLQQKNAIVEYVYNACHMWSEKHPERAEDILDANIREHTWEVTGPAAMQTVCHNTHSVFENFSSDSPRNHF